MYISSQSKIYCSLLLVLFEADSYIIDVEAITFAKIAISESLSDPPQDE